MKFNFYQFNFYRFTVVNEPLNNLNFNGGPSTWTSAGSADGLSFALPDFFDRFSM